MMNSLLARRNVFLVLSSLAILALVLLSGGLNDVTFAEPRPFNQTGSEDISASVASLLQDLASIPRWQQITFWLAIYLFVLIITTLLSPELRKHLLRTVLRLAVFSFVILYLLRNPQTFAIEEVAPVEEEAGPPTLYLPVDAPPPVYSPPVLPPVLIYIVSVVVILLVIGLLWFIGRRFSRWMSPSPPPLLGDIAAVARSSLQDLSAGLNMEDAILQCYARMIEVISRRRGFQRDPDLTPSEFASYLEGAGLPADAVRRLTRLFESVRYGGRISGLRESTEAADCLRAVLHYCGENA